MNYKKIRKLVLKEYESGSKYAYAYDEMTTAVVTDAGARLILVPDEEFPYDLRKFDGSKSAVIREDRSEAYYVGMLLMEEQKTVAKVFLNKDTNEITFARSTLFDCFYDPIIRYETDEIMTYVFEGEKLCGCVINIPGTSSDYAMANTLIKTKKAQGEL